MIVKDHTIDLTGLRAPIVSAMVKLDQWHRAHTGHVLVITSAAEPIKHSAMRSAHYRGDAIDVRNWYLKACDSNLDKWADKIRQLLGDDYFVLNEETHFHIHWSPVYSGPGR